MNKYLHSLIQNYGDSQEDSYLTLESKLKISFSIRYFSLSNEHNLLSHLTNPPNTGEKRREEFELATSYGSEVPSNQIIPCF
ncbi:hypothetical protein Y032_0119g879 [Ancylostoma ceylanicum]|uniref:Uncharacterized protein n=1 Tax=Ancylostoma ceylanicum TaxID=53326 RepID=A0A016TBB4_9BILA|nr:hypothetical protein Y032_0119g879 [Ancylostoma ceylanicum]